MNSDDRGVDHYLHADCIESDQLIEPEGLLNSET